MKTKTVKELKEKIEAEIKEDYDFEQYLFKKYPSLFPTDQDGELLPQFQRCWNDCPKGWEQLVDDLFGCIDGYIKNTTKTEINPKKKVKTWIYRNAGTKMLSQLDRIFNPYKNDKLVLTAIESAKQRAKRDKLFSMKVRRFTSTIRAWFLSEMYTYNNPTQVKIGQYKEKFGTLRVYVDNADDDVDGMIRFAEYLSSKTCQDTGKRGQLCKRGMWYSTLCQEESETHGYTPINTSV
jgi:hypothetical protein